MGNDEADEADLRLDMTCFSLLQLDIYGGMSTCKLVF